MTAGKEGKESRAYGCQEDLQEENRQMTRSEGNHERTKQEKLGLNIH